MIIKAITHKPGYQNSSIMTEVYELNVPEVYVVSVGVDEYGSDTWAIMSDGTIYIFGIYATGIDFYWYEYPDMLIKSSPSANILYGTTRQGEGMLLIDENHQLWWLGDGGQHTTLDGGTHYSEDIVLGTTDIDFAIQEASSVPPILYKVSKGQYASAGIDINGKLWSWGCNATWGSLGNNQTDSSCEYIPIEPTLSVANSGWTHIHKGWSSAHAIRNGEMWAWGPNNSGMLGVGCDQYLSWSWRWEWQLSGSGTNEYYLTEVGAGDPGIAEPSHIYQYTTPYSYLNLGILGSLAVGEWAWGDNDTLGYNTVYVRLSSANPDPDVYNDTMIRPRWNKPVRIGTDSDWVKVECQEYTTIALKSDGTLWGWGDNYRGSMGHDPATCTTYDRIDTTPPITWCEHWSPWEIPMPSGKTFVDFSAGYYHIIGLEADGTAWAIGYDDYVGCLGIGSFGGSVYTWTEIPDIKFEAVHCNYSNSIGIGLDGKVYVWGYHYGVGMDGVHTPLHWNFGGYW